MGITVDCGWRITVVWYIIQLHCCPCYRVQRVLEKSWKSLNLKKNSRTLKVLEKCLNLNVPYFEIFANHWHFFLRFFSTDFYYFTMDYKWFDVDNLLLSLVQLQYWWLSTLKYIFHSKFWCSASMICLFINTLVLENCSFLESLWKVLEFCRFSLLWTLLLTHVALDQQV